MTARKLSFRHVRSQLKPCFKTVDSNTPFSLQDIKKLESTQRAFTRYIRGFHSLSYWDRLKKLGLMSLQRRRERYVIFIFTCGRYSKAQYPTISTSSSMITLALVLAAVGSQTAADKRYKR